MVPFLFQRADDPSCVDWEWVAIFAFYAVITAVVWYVLLAPAFSPEL